MIDSMKVKRSIYFAILQGCVIFETELYIDVTVKCVFRHSFCYFSWYMRVVRKDLGLCLYLIILYYTINDISLLKSLPYIWENWNQNLHTFVDIGLQGNQCSASWSTLNLRFSKTWRQETNCAHIGLMAFKYNNLHGFMTLSLQYVCKIL